MLTHAQHASPTAVICENLERFGGAPARDEPDPRAIWDESEALAGLETVLDAFVEEIAPDGTQLADERESLLWGFVNTLHMQTVRLDRAVDKLSPKLKDLQASQDGSEVAAWELERIIERAQHLGDRRDAFERLRDAAAERYLSDTGNTWRPRHGSHISRTSQLTSAAIDARDFLRARETEKTQAHLPEGTLVAVTGSKPVDDADRICNALDRVRTKYPDMVLVYIGISTLCYALVLVCTDNHKASVGQAVPLPSPTTAHYARLRFLVLIIRLTGFRFAVSSSA